MLLLYNCPQGSFVPREKNFHPSSRGQWRVSLCHRSLPSFNASFPARRNLLNPIPKLQNRLKQLNSSRECTCAICVPNLSDFCMRSGKKPVKFSLRNALDFSWVNAICEGKFGSIRVSLRSFARRTANSARKSYNYDLAYVYSLQSRVHFVAIPTPATLLSYRARGDEIKCLINLGFGADEP